MKLIIIKWKEAMDNRPVGKYLGWPRPEEAAAEEIKGQIELRTSDSTSELYGW